LFFFFFWRYWGLNSTYTQPALFCDGCFQDKVSWTICLGLASNGSLLISSSWVARITGVSHWWELGTDTAVMMIIPYFLGCPWNCHFQIQQSHIIPFINILTLNDPTLMSFCPVTGEWTCQNKILKSFFFSSIKVLLLTIRKKNYRWYKLLHLLIYNYFMRLSLQFVLVEECTILIVVTSWWCRKTYYSFFGWVKMQNMQLYFGPQNEDCS
jgi:hypothetical protein